MSGDGVIPAHAGIQSINTSPGRGNSQSLDPGMRRDDVLPG
jgi:hypothetical protein